MVPAIPVGCATLGHGLDKDAQLLQAHVGSGPHANDADAQALRVCEAEGEKPWLAGIRHPILTPRSSFLSQVIPKLGVIPRWGKKLGLYPPPFCQANSVGLLPALCPIQRADRQLAGCVRVAGVWQTTVYTDKGVWLQWGLIQD